MGALQGSRCASGVAGLLPCARCLRRQQCLVSQCSFLSRFCLRVQVRRRSDGAWVDAAPPPGVFICNVADCMQRWTGDEYVSTPHRVIIPRGAPERFSIALFLGSEPDVVVESLPQPAFVISHSAGGSKARTYYPPVTAGEYLRQRLLATYPLYREGAGTVAEDGRAATGGD